MGNTIDCSQRSPEWYQARLGKITASRVADVMAKTKSGYSASRKNYMAELLCQRLTGEREEDFESASMRWGTETEPFARSAYEARFGVLVEEVGFIDHPSIPMFGASPDGLVGLEGMTEIKCPNTMTHIEYLTTGKVDTKYIYQMMTQMMCAVRKWCDFVSYDPRLPANLSMFVTRFYWDDHMIGTIEDEVIQFNAELDALIEKLKSI